MKLEPGLYEAIITEAMHRGLDERAERRSLTEHDGRRLADHLAHRLRAALDALPGGRDPTRQVALINELVGVIERHARGFPAEDDAVRPELLTAIRPGEDPPPPRPQLPLSESGLYIGANRERRLDRALDLEIRSADRVDLICAFLFWSGYRTVRSAIRDHLAAGKPMRVLTTVYGRVTQSKVLDDLTALGADVRVSYETGSTRLHAKAWLLHRDSTFSTAFVGSSNLSHTALTSGLEWNVRLSQVENGGVLHALAGAFDNHWHDEEFRPYQPQEFAEAMAALRGPHLRAVFSLRARPYQSIVLERLDAERTLHDRHRNLVVAATGTGKTVVAALDYRRLCAKAGRRLRLLFVAHRREILHQSLHVFCHAMSDGAFGEVWVDGQRPHRNEHVFASIQSLHRADVSSMFDREHFEVVVVDEFHHAAADTYDALLRWIRPVELLGLTATPERADGRSVLEWFDGRIASELRLWDAIDRGFLVPFQYLAVADGTDLRGAWARGRGRYDVRRLTNLYTGHHARAHLIVEAVRGHIADPVSMRALGFCVGVDHARFMADAFQRAGIPSAAVLGESSPAERDTAIGALRDGALACIFAVDVFNEGVDIPEVDTVLFLRPTESATIFLQQLGRGLRRAEGKRCLTVLDFVGQPHEGFRYADRFRSLLGRVGRSELKRQVRAGFPYLPAGCSIQLDRRSQEIVLDNISRSLRLDRRSLGRELRDSGATTLGGFVDAAGLALEDLYRGGRTFSDIARAAGLAVAPPGPSEARIGRGLGRLIHVDDPLRLEGWSRWLDDARRPCPPRLRSMLLTTIFGATAVADPDAAMRTLAGHPALMTELRALLELMTERTDHRTLAWMNRAKLPLQLHARYRLNEIMAAMGDVRGGRLYLPREGVHYDAASNCNLLFVTVDKDADAFSPSTMYADYALGPSRFHWQSQSGTRPSDTKGLRHVEHVERGITPLLFVRPRKQDDRGVSMPYSFLGPVRIESWSGERPMDVVWSLAHPMPADLLTAARVVA